MSRAVQAHVVSYPKGWHPKEMFSVRSTESVRDNWTSLFKNKINNWHIHTFGSQKQGRSTNNFSCTFVTSRWHLVILWWDFEVTCSFKTWDWNKLLRAEHFLPVVCRVRQQGKMCSPSSPSIKKGSAGLFFALKYQCGSSPGQALSAVLPVSSASSLGMATLGLLQQ